MAELKEKIIVKRADEAELIEKAHLAAYAHGEYYALGKKLGSFGFAAAKKSKNKKSKNKSNTSKEKQ